MLPFGKYWNAPAAKGTNSVTVIRQVLVLPTAAACYKLIFCLEIKGSEQ